MTNFPNSADNLTDPIAGDPLSLSNGKPSTQYVKDLNDAVEAIEAAALQRTSGSVLSVDGFAAKTATIINSCDSAVGWGSSGAQVAPATDSVTYFTAPSSVKAELYDTTGTLGKMYYNFGSLQGMQGYTQGSMSIRWSTGGSSQWPDNWQVVVADSTNLTGNRSVVHIDQAEPANTWFTVSVPLTGLSGVRSFGIEAVNYKSNADSTWWFIDNVCLGPQTQYETALGAAGGNALVVPPDATVEQLPVAFLNRQTLVDLRSDNAFISNLDGIRHLRDWGPDETGATDSWYRIQQALDALNDEETLLFPKGKSFTISDTLTLPSKRNLTIDFNGCTLFADWGIKIVDVPADAHDATVKNFTFRGIREQARLANLTTDTGTPTWTGSAWTLDAKDDAVILPANVYARTDVDGNIVCDVEAQDTNHVANDLLFEWIDSWAPAAPTLAQTGTQGSIPAGKTFVYRIVDVYADGTVSGYSRPASITTTNWCNITVTLPAVTATKPPIIARRIYRRLNPSDPWAFDGTRGLNEVPASVTSYLDTQINIDADWTNTSTSGTTTLADAGAGVLEAMDYNYAVTTVLTTGEETAYVASVSTAHLSVADNRQIQVTLPGTGDPNVIARKVYRSVEAWGSTNMAKARGFRLLPNGNVQDNTTASIIDNTPTLSLGAVRLPAGDQNNDYSDCPRQQDFGYHTVPVLTGSPVTYQYNFAAGESALRTKLQLRISKATSTANTITISALTTYGKATYDSGNEGGHGVGTNTGVRNVRIENGLVECVSGDAVQIEGDYCYIKNVTSRCAGRQGMSYTNGRLLTLEGCKIFESGRSGLDIEPWAAQRTDGVVLIDCEFRNTENYPVAGHTCPYVFVHGLKSTSRAKWDGGNEEFSFPDTLYAYIRHVHGPWLTLSVTGGDVTIDDIDVYDLNVMGDVKFTEDELYPSTRSRAYISNVRVYNNPVLTIPRTTVVGLFRTNVVSDTSLGTVSALYDPGAERASGDAKGVVAGPLWWPRGVDTLDEGAHQVRGLSSSSTRANNLSGTVSVSGAAASKAVTFSTHSYTPTVHGTPELSATTGGTLPNASYYYRIATRPLLGGAKNAAAQVGPVALAGSNNAVIIKVVTDYLATTGERIQYPIDGLVIWRGTSSGIYTARYDLLPTNDYGHFLGVHTAANNQVWLYDLGATLAWYGGDSDTTYDEPGNSYPQTTAATAHVVNPDNYLVADESGFESDASYKVFVQCSWATTTTISKTRDGFTVTFGTAAPGGGGTLDWFIVR